MYKILSRTHFKDGWAADIAYDPKLPFWRQDIFPQWVAHRHKSVDQFDVWRRPDVINDARSCFGSSKALIETLGIRNVLSVGSGFGYHELLMQAENSQIRVVASDVLPQFCERRKASLNEAPLHGFPQSIEFIHLDVLDKSTYANVPFSDIDLILFVGSTAPFVDYEIASFLKHLAPHYVVIVAKTGEQYSVLRHLYFMAISLWQRLTGGRQVLLGYMRTRRQYEQLMKGAGYVLRDSAIYIKPTHVPFLRDTNGVYVFARSDQPPNAVNASHLWRFL